MQTQVRPPRPRSSGGRTLMLLGLVLALAAAAIVFYITSSVQGTFSQTVTVVTAKVNLKEGTILSITDATPPYMLIQDAFGVKQVDKNVAPLDSYAFTNQDALNTALNKKIVNQQFLQGDFLRTSDPRLVDIGTASGTSETNINPPVLKNGQVLFVLPTDNADIGVQPGDHINLIATVGVIYLDPKGNPVTDIISQTTLTNVYVYAVDVPAKGKIMVVLSNQDAVTLAELEHSGFFTLTIVIRNPGDPTDPSGANPPGGNGSPNQPTNPVDGNSILKHFGIAPPQ